MKYFLVLFAFFFVFSATLGLALNDNNQQGEAIDDDFLIIRRGHGPIQVEKELAKVSENEIDEMLRGIDRDEASITHGINNECGFKCHWCYHECHDKAHFSKAECTEECGGAPEMNQESRFKKMMNEEFIITGPRKQIQEKKKHYNNYSFSRHFIPGAFHAPGKLPKPSAF